MTGDDPVKSGLVPSLNRPGGNLTGVTFFGGSLLGAKRVELLHDLVPKAAVIAVLLNPNYTGFEAELPEIEAAGHAIGRQIVVVKAASEPEFELAFARIVQARAGALLVGGGPLLHHSTSTTCRAGSTPCAAGHLPATRIRCGRRPDQLLGKLQLAPIVRPASTPAAFSKAPSRPNCRSCSRPRSNWLSTCKTAKALGLEVPPSIHLRADEVIE